MPANTTEFRQDINKGLIALLFIIIILLIIGLFSVISFTNDKISQNETKTTSLVKEAALQKDEKNKIRKIWQDQAAQNDKLVSSQDNVFSQVRLYADEVKNSIRFIDGQAQILPSISEKKLKDNLDQLNLDIKNLQETTIENTKQKDKNKATIDAIYINSGETQPNSAK